MRIVPAAEIDQATDLRALIEALRGAFRTDWVTPPPSQQEIVRPDGPTTVLGLAAGWTDFEAQGHAGRGYIGVRLTTETRTPDKPGNAALSGLYVVFSGITGEPLALLDGRALMRWRVAASSALAATYLARSDAARLLLVGAGTLMPYLADAHCAVRPIREILVWNRTPVHAEPLVKRLGAAERTASVTDDLEAAVRGADVICCATRAFEPLINGHWLPQGVHLDLIGSAPTHLEADRHAVRLCRVYLDDRSGLAANTSPQNMVALTDGEAATALVAEDIEGDLAGLARGIHGGRRRYDDRTMYVSTGSTFEDLAAAVHVLMRL